MRRAGYFKDNDGIDLYTMDGKERLENFSTYIRQRDALTVAVERDADCVQIYAVSLPFIWTRRINGELTARNV